MSPPLLVYNDKVPALMTALIKHKIMAGVIRT